VIVGTGPSTGTPGESPRNFTSDALTSECSALVTIVPIGSSAPEHPLPFDPFWQ